ncbi:hypothetical protein KKA50_02015 [Patescibacteria group bacterium]|nr:hypothetical protein [Patescibacteria group bacterium]
MISKVGFESNDIKSQTAQTDLYSKELIFQGALRFFLHIPKEIDKKTFKIAKDILNEIEIWEIGYGNKKFSKLKNNSILVGYLAYKFGELTGLDKKELSNVYIAGLVQDIGKIYMCDGNKALAYEYITSPLKKGEKGFEEIAKALKKYPSKTREYLEKNTKLNGYIVDAAANYHSIYSNLFKEGYPDSDKEISQLDTVLWFADSLSAVSFSSIDQLQRNYSKDRYISLIEGFELLREQTEEKIPKFWGKASSTTLMSLVFTMIMGMVSTSKLHAANYTSQEVIALANEDRATLGLEPLNADEKLMQAAMDKAKDMFEKGYWDHYGPNGETPWQFIKGEGYEYKIAGENLAKGFTDVNRMNQAWLDSQTHRDNILKPEYEAIGVAVMDGTLEGQDVTLVVQMFAKEKEEPKVESKSDDASTTEKKTAEGMLLSFKDLLERIREILKGE